MNLKTAKKNPTNFDLATHILDQFKQDITSHALKIEKSASSTGYSEYQGRSIAFIENVLGEKITPDVKLLCKSIEQNPITFGESANGTGKSLPIDTLIPTPNGWTTIGQLIVGDYVFGDDGKPTLITGVYPQGEQKTYRIDFNDYTSIFASKDHLWKAVSASQKSRKKDCSIYTTKQLRNLKHKVMSIPLCLPVEYEKKHYRLHPYLVGVLIGDGTLGQQVRFDSEDGFIIRKVERLLKNKAKLAYYRETHYGIVTVRGDSNPILDACRYYNMIGKGAKQKNIPEEFMYGAVNQRKALLYGLMDTDGYIDSRGIISFCTISEELSRQFIELIQSLGGTARVSTKVPTYTHKGEHRNGQLCYIISVCLDFCPFSLPRKVERWNPRQYGKCRTIKNISYVGKRESVCIKVEAKNGLFLAKNYIVTHNTHIAARIAVWFYKAYKGAQVYTASAPPEENLKKLLWGEIGNVVARNPGLFGSDKISLSSLDIRRSPLEFITGVTIPQAGDSANRKARFSGKHAPFLLFIIDEGDAVPADIYEAIESCMSGGFARLLVLYNPRQKSGYVYQAAKSKKANVVTLSAFTHPNVISGQDLIPGAVTREVTARRISEWTRPCISGENLVDTFVVPEFLVGYRAKKLDGIGVHEPIAPGFRKVIVPAFSYMVLGRASSMSENQLIDRNWCDLARLRWDKYVAANGEVPPAGTRPKMGLDVAEFGADFSVGTFRYGGFCARQALWGGVDVMVTANEAQRLADEFYADSIYVDSNGLGAGVWARLIELKYNAFRIMVQASPTEKQMLDGEVLGEFDRIRDQGWWTMREWLRTEEAMLPPEADEQFGLIDQLCSATYFRQPNTNRMKICDNDTMKEKLMGKSPDQASSLMLTFCPIPEDQGAKDLDSFNYLY